RMCYLDVGGGLAVDYDGSKTDFHASKNYNIQEYANDVVFGILDACNKANVPVPTVVTESGRAITAHQSVLIFEVGGTNDVRFGEPEPPPPDSHAILRGLYETWKNVVPKNVQEAWHDASQAKEEAQSLFKFGYVGLRERAQVEKLYWGCCVKILQTVRRMRFVPDELRDLERVLAAIYYCNFSIFQSAPDTWAIDQLFPIMPIHRLDEEPTERATIADLTCDTNAVHVRLAEGQGYHVSHVVKGDSVAEVLHYVQYKTEDLVERVRQQAESALRTNQITLAQMRLLMRHYEESLGKYTYLSDDDD